MLVFESFIAGFTSVLGAVVGVLVVFMLIPLKKKSKKVNYEAGDLIRPFEIYLDELAERDRYEEMELVILIIDHLREVKIIESVHCYHIKKIPKMIFRSHGSDTEFRFLSDYKVIQRYNMDLNEVGK